MGDTGKKDFWKDTLWPLVAKLEARYFRYPAIGDKPGKRKILYEYQVEANRKFVHAIIAKTGKTLTSLFCRQSGKTEDVGWSLAVTAMVINTISLTTGWMRDRFPEGLRIVGYAPSDGRQAKTVLKRFRLFYRPFIAVMQQAIPELQEVVKGEEKMVVGVVNPDGTISQWLSFEVRTAGATSKGIEGPTADVVFVEEAQGVTDDVYYAGVVPVTTATGGPIILIGTYDAERNFFDKAIEYNESMHPECHIYADIDRVIAAGNLMAARKYNNLCRELGENHPAIVLKYKLKRGDQSGMLFTVHSWRKILLPVDGELQITNYELRTNNPGYQLPSIVRRVRSGVELAGLLEEQGLPQNWGLVISIDLASGGDRSVLKATLHDWSNRRDETELEEEVGLRWLPQMYQVLSRSWHGIEYRDQLPEMIDEIEPLLPWLGGIAIDNTGERGGVCRSLEDEGYPMLPVEFSPGVKGEFSKAKMCMQYGNALGNGNFRVVVDKPFVGSDEWNMLITGKVADLEEGATFGELPYQEHKADALATKRKVDKRGAVTYVADPPDNDDHITGDVLAVYACQECEPGAGHIVATGGRDSGVVAIQNELRGDRNRIAHGGPESVGGMKCPWA